ncbi:MAG: NupC/NupG family nucleoside CNT transporter [Bdellovibrionales bacterium]|nr:NupC/NupG family nucleoside CNT transporter [Bdellovibrionales bacterium]
MGRWIGFFGLTGFILISYFMSERKDKVSWKLVAWGMVLQIFLAISVLGIPALGIPGPLRFIFDMANTAIVAALEFTEEGSRFVFGELLNVQKSGFIFAFQVLPTIIFMASLMAVLYHLGVMQKLVNGIAYIMQKTMGISGAESLSTAANIFVGQTEAPLVIKPYVGSLTRSELFAVMVGGMASVAGGVMAAYVGLLKDRIPDIAGHLLTASVMSAPATLVIAKLMIPETIHPETLGKLPKSSEEVIDRNVIEAAARGANEGLLLALNVAAMLLAFIALIAMVNALFVQFGHLIGFDHWGINSIPEVFRGNKPTELSFQVILGWLFSPIAFLMGVPWAESGMAGTLLGEKIVFNEFVAYLHLSEISAQVSHRTMIILSYALCGFANFCSIAIQIGGIGGMAPTRKSDLAEMGIRSVIAGSFSTFMTATIAGILI